MIIGNGNRIATVSRVGLPDEDALAEHRNRLLHGPERAGCVNLDTVRCHSCALSRIWTATNIHELVEVI
jgi:hypothetical protein